MPVPVAPVPPAKPRLVPVPVLVLVFFSFSWSMSHRELWLARTGSSSGGLSRPLAARGLWPGRNWWGDEGGEGHDCLLNRVLDKCTDAVTAHACVLYLGTAGLVFFLAAIQHGHIITLLCHRRPDGAMKHTWRLERERDSRGRVGTTQHIGYTCVPQQHPILYDWAVSTCVFKVRVKG